jgi:hypothetical protein
MILQTLYKLMYCVVEVTTIIFIITSLCKSFVIKLIVVLTFFINLSPSYIKLKRS